MQFVKAFIVQFFKPRKRCNIGLVKTKLIINNSNIPVAGGYGVLDHIVKDMRHFVFGLETISKVFSTLRYRVTEQHRALIFKFPFSVQLLFSVPPCLNFTVLR